MLDGHFDYGNGYHGRVYLNPHQLFRHPSTIWRFAQDLHRPAAGELRRSRPRSWPGRSTGGALLAHTIAGLLDSRRSLTHPPCSFAPFNYDAGRRLRAAAVLPPRARRASACCWPTTCGTPARRSRAARRSCEEAGGTVLATVEIYDRLEAIVDLGVPNIALAEYKAPENYTAADCPLCAQKMPDHLVF